VMMLAAVVALLSFLVQPGTTKFIYNLQMFFIVAAIVGGGPLRRALEWAIRTRGPALAGALLGGSRLLGLAASAAFLAVGGLTLAGGAFLPGGGFYGLGFGALQAAGMSWLSRRLRGAPFAAALARFGATGALGGAAGALLAGTPLWMLAIPAGLLLALFAFRAQTPT